MNFHNAPNDGDHDRPDESWCGIAIAFGRSWSRSIQSATLQTHRDSSAARCALTSE
jgi:hypothetical protein